MGFNTQPPEGGCFSPLDYKTLNCKFQHTAARRRLRAAVKILRALESVFQHTAARRRLRPIWFIYYPFTSCFNTQPPEGGCLTIFFFLIKLTLFQHTAARRRLQISLKEAIMKNLVSTHSRPKAAAIPTSSIT